MAYVQERCRRLSYAGQVKTTSQKSRRVSYAGQTSLNTQSARVIEETPLENGYSFTTMLHSVEGINMSRLDSNKNRSVRRNNRPSEDRFTCSQQSVLSAMDRFVRAVNNMDATVLVPSRLQDMEFLSDADDKPTVPSGITQADLFSFYSMLKEVKNELLWGPVLTPTPAVLNDANGRTSPRGLKHLRQSSDDSLGSTGFPSDQETDSDLESVVADSVDEQTSQGSIVGNAFRYHLQGLHTILNQLAESADYLTTRYQVAVDASSL